MILMNLYAGQDYSDIENRLVATGREGECGMN